MARKTNILAFDDAKVASRRRRVPVAERQASSRWPEYASPYSSPRNSDFVKPKAQRSASDYGYDYESYYGYGAPFDFDDESIEDERVDEARYRSASVRRKRKGDTSARAESVQVREPKVSTQAESKGDARKQRRRERTKMRAEKLFKKQYDTDSVASGQQEGAPRAALYEGKMGSSHRKSARMQRASVALPQTAKINPAGWFSGLNVSARTLRLGTALLCVILIGVFLYAPAQQYYQSMREHDRLAAEYAVIEQRNEALSEQNTALASNAGMEDAVRQRYGYVVGGDETAIVSGLSDYATDTSRDSDGIEANVLASSVKAPEEWYTPYLDAFFGVS